MLYDLDSTTPETQNVPSAFTFKEPLGNNAPLNILLVEDVVSEVVLTRLSLDKTQIPYNMQTLDKGSNVLPYLAKYNFAKYQKDADVKLPDLIMLDLGLPGMNGFDILESLVNAHAMIRAVPIVILSAYKHFDYLRKTNNLWIPAYITKPCDPDKLREVLITVRHGRTPELQA